jgi:hypothetical protein
VKFIVGLDMDIDDESFTTEEAKTVVYSRFAGSGIKVSNIRVLEDDR